MAKAEVGAAKRRRGRGAVAAVLAVAVAWAACLPRAEAQTNNPRAMAASGRLRELLQALAQGDAVGFETAIEYDGLARSFLARQDPNAAERATEADLPAFTSGLRAGFAKLAAELRRQFHPGSFVTLTPIALPDEVRITVRAQVGDIPYYTTFHLVERADGWRIVNLSYPLLRQDYVGIALAGQAAVGVGAATPGETGPAAQAGFSPVRATVGLVVALGLAWAGRRLARTRSVGRVAVLSSAGLWAGVALLLAFPGAYLAGSWPGGRATGAGTEPGGVNAAWSEASTLLGRGDAQGALRRLDAAGEAGKRDRLAMLHRGIALVALGRLPEAEAALRGTLALDPGLPLAEIQLAQLARRQARLDEAATHLQAALDALGQDDWLLSELGWVQALGGRFEEAERTFARGLDVAPESGCCLLARARSRVRAGRKREALDDLERIGRALGLKEAGVRADPELGRLVDEPGFRRLFPPRAQEAEPPPAK